MTEILEVRNLHKSYGKIKAVNYLSFTVRKGDVFGILGPNGSGKTTTLSMLTGVVNPLSGSWKWFGGNAGKNVRKQLGVLLEKPNFYGYLSAVNNLKIVADIRGVSFTTIDDVLRKVGLYERRNSRFSTYSLGMKQRLAIGSALLGDPPVLILDEPTNGLDAEGIAEIRDLIIDLSGEGRTILIASHYLDEVQKVCSDVLVMKHGQKIYEGKVGALLSDTTRIAIDAPDKARLKQIVQTHPKVIEQVDENGMLMLSVEDTCTADEINSYVFEYGLVLSHLSVESASLEEKILSLLKTENEHEAV